MVIFKIVQTHLKPSLIYDEEEKKSTLFGSKTTQDVGLTCCLSFSLLSRVENL